MRGIKLVIFDLDGTLVDAYSAIVKSFNYTMKKSGYCLQDPGIIRKAVGWGDRNLLKNFVKRKDLDKALLLYRSHHEKALLKWSKLMPSTRSTLNILKKKGYKLAVASNRPTKFSLILLHHLKIRRYFDHVLCADKLKNMKPHPQIINEILGKFRLVPEEAVFVGDMALDAVTARRAGVKSIMVTTGSNTAREIRKEKPCMIKPGIKYLNKVL